MPVFGVILIRIFPAISRIWTEYGEIKIISPYSVRMRENAGKMRTRITPNTDTFYAVTRLQETDNSIVINGFIQMRTINMPSLPKNQSMNFVYFLLVKFLNELLDGSSEKQLIYLMLNRHFRPLHKIYKSFMRIHQKGEFC